jgi:hypothetical protein
MRRKQKNWTLFIGIVTALVVVLSQLFLFQPSPISKKSTEEAQTTNTEKSTKQEAHISLPSSLPSGNTVVVENEFSFIHDIVFETASSCATCKTVLSTTGKFFQTLFRVIIAPNAP